MNYKYFRQDDFSSVVTIFAEFISPFKMAQGGRKERMKGGRWDWVDDFYLKEEE